MSRWRIASGLTGLGFFAACLAANPAAAEPATTVSFPPSASATWFSGSAFDTCSAPSVATLQAWTASPFDAVGAYIGGINRSCAQPNLTASWVTSVSRARWRIIPIYLGLQPPCSTRPHKFTAATAVSAGTANASDAVKQAKAVGMLPGSAIYGDVENYNAADSSCRNAALAYVSAWTKELHRAGYLSGVYANLSSGAKQLSDVYNSSSYARPDALWIARWDGDSTLTGWSGVGNERWSNHQRGKQYRGDHDETYGGVRINIDSDRFDAPVATVAYAFRNTSTGSLNARSAPATTAPIVRTYAGGTSLGVVCQTPGSTVSTTSVWNKLTDGSYVSDYYVATPSNTTYSAPLPRCTYPFQVTASTLYKRTGPGGSSATAGTLSGGALAWIYCQRSGTKVGTTSVWDRLDDSRYVTDYYVATPSTTTYSKPIPRC